MWSCLYATLSVACFLEHIVELNLHKHLLCVMTCVCNVYEAQTRKAAEHANV